MSYVMEMVACESVILREIEMKETTRKSIARTYAICLRAEYRKDWPEKMDWLKINNAIIARWSKSGLTFIKELAWKIAEGKVKFSQQ